MQRPVYVFFACIAAALIMTLAAPGLAGTVWPPVATPPQINVTSDSAPGWLPSAEQEAGVRKAAEDFLAARDGGRAADAYAYALLADINRSSQPYADYAAEIARFNQQAGPVKERRIVAVTWTKDPAQAPQPGVYAALDLVSRFAEVDRHCGYMVLYQPPGGGAFQVMREESNYLDNASAREIEKEHSSAGVEAAWAQLSTNCPNYVAPAAPPLPEQSQSTIGYPSVEAALAALHAKPGVAFSTQNGWTVADDASADAIWSFPPPGDPAYPAAVRRRIIQDGGGASVQTDIHCQAPKPACDHLVRQFEQLDAEMRASLRRK